jgi:hypothetical protein
LKIFEPSTLFNINALDEGSVKYFIDLKKINQLRYINKFFEAVNEKLPFRGCYIGCIETAEQREKRILGSANIIFSYPAYLIDFAIHRIMPKCKSTKKLYFWATKGHRRAISLAETLGRLVSCGFEIVEYKEIKDRTYFAVKKINFPKHDSEPSYGLLFKMKRTGQNGKIISVFKLRTMHPYAEYLQDYVYRQNNLQEGGKFKDDFRITSLGKHLRRLWIDELPMLFNWIRGDLKLVGVRPLSSQYLNLYKPSLQIKRMQFKPGLIPPFYSDLPKTLDEIMDSEERYLNAYEKNPGITDIRYFFKACVNILLKQVRSA